MPYRSRLGLGRGREKVPAGDVEQVAAFLAKSRRLADGWTAHSSLVEDHLANSEERAESYKKSIEEVAAALATIDEVSDRRVRDLLETAYKGLYIAARQLVDSVAQQHLVGATKERLLLACEEFGSGCALLERELAKYRDLFDGEATPIVITDEKAHVRDANRAAAATLRIDRRKLMGRSLAAFVAQQDVRRFRAFTSPLWSTLGSSERSVEMRIRRRGRATLPAKLSVRLIRGDRSKVGLRWTISPIDHGGRATRR